jgi:hypothetical protein
MSGRKSGAQTEQPKAYAAEDEPSNGPRSVSVSSTRSVLRAGTQESQAFRVIRRTDWELLKRRVERTEGDSLSLDPPPLNPDGA